MCRDKGVGVADFGTGAQEYSINLLCSYKSTSADSKDFQAEQRGDPHSDKTYEQKNARLEGMDFLLDECGKLRPKGAFSDPLLCNGLQLAGVLNIQLAMEADAQGAVLTYADVC